jgi:phosphoenolpyruvate-protein phosphotransferase
MAQARPAEEEPAVRSAEIQVCNESGLHARPAAVFARAAAGFRAAVTLRNLTAGGEVADAKSLVGVLGAGVEKGHQVRIEAVGEDEEQAVAVLCNLVAAGLGEIAGESATTGEPGTARGSGTAAKTPASAVSAGLPAARGIAVGPVWRYRPGEKAQPGEAAQAGDAEARIREAAATAAEQLRAMAAWLHDRGQAGEAEIVEAQALMAVDPMLVDEAVRLARGGLDPVSAMLASAEASAGALDNLADELLAARATDVRDVGARLARILTRAAIELPAEPSIIVADQLPPSLVVELPPGRLLGLALAGGSPTSHAAILARGLGIPVVVAAEGLLEAVAAAGATTIALDGETGEIALDPDEKERAALAERRLARDERDRRAAALRDRPCATADGQRVALMANIRSPDDAPRARAAGAEGIGLFRTEFLYLRRQAPPSEDEQVAAYRRAIEAFGPKAPDEPERKVVVRLADIGGDKSIPYLGLPAEPNPFLGVRAIRLAERGSRELLLTQLRAIWRAAGLAGVTPHAMAPMVSTVADARLLLELRDEARRAVAAGGGPCPDRMVTGLMIEVPSAAILAPELARLVDFFSLGTNDLTQYVLAADRDNPSLARLQDALHPAVLRTIAGVVAGADGAGIPVAACGELAGDPAGALVLVGLGVDELSAEAGSLDGVRGALAAVTRAELDELAARALAATDAETVRQMAAQLLARGR